ncbi:family 16 glycoside hydrolase [Planctomycetes bacterium K23_9]|uniref:Cytochrome c n=1 Tax=Stieleria marina TaxID=1930275 RepID=A0A517P1D4_9BACT|nr:Cytochrome c [Planctomycetes bacterium K23_9]
MPRSQSTNPEHESRVRMQGTNIGIKHRASERDLDHTVWLELKPYHHRLDRMRFLLLALNVLFCLSLCSGQVFETLEKASDNPDFELQGEYVDSTRGLQVVALGDGEFQVVTYTDGLPGAGWNGKDKKVIEVDADAVEALLSNFDRVERKSPTLGAQPPSGAVVLFDGTRDSLEKHWKKGAKITGDGLLQEGATSRDTFGDYSLHLEFRTPFMPAARGQARGNSGVYHQGRFETQILDSFGLDGKMDETGGIYTIRAPDLNMCLPPLVWQTYDVDFTAARYGADGKKIANAAITVKLNGVVVQRDVALPHITRAAPNKEGPDAGPIFLQNHGNPVRYRNIWVRERDLVAEARRPIVPGFERFHAGGVDMIEGGRLLIGELNCVACHAGDDALVDFVQPKQAPNLDDVGARVRPEWMLEFISQPHDTKPGTTMPDVLASMSKEQRAETAEALTHFLVGEDLVVVDEKLGDASKGEDLFHQSGCVACHLPRNDRKANRATSVPLTGIEKKYTRTSLEAFLKDPLAVRPSGRMPQLDLGKNNWLHVAQYLTDDSSTSAGTRDREMPKQPNLRFKAYLKTVSQLPDLSQLKPSQEGESKGLNLASAGRNTKFILSFRGFLPIQKTGVYRFRLGADDGARLYIDDKQVIDNDGIHPHEEKDGKVQLAAGVHEIRVDYFDGGGQKSLTLDWSGPGAQMRPIDRFIVLNADSPLPEDLPAISNEQSDGFVFDGQKAARGQQLFSELGCAACHSKTIDGRRIKSAISPPKLAACDSLQGCLGDGTANAPQFDLTSIQASAVIAAINAELPKAESATTLNHTMKSLNCYACHVRDGIGGAESDRNVLFESTIPEMGDEGRLPPPLNGVGDKLRSDWINQVVSNGDKSRPYMKTFMPKFGKANAGHLADVFAKLDQKTEATIDKVDDPAKRQVALGRQMVGAKGLACVSCHTYGDFKSSGIQAIALDTMTQRIREDWFHRYLPDPQKYRPGTRMPTGFPEGKSTVTNIYGGDPSKQLSAMWAFLEKGAKGGVPEGIVGGMAELKPVDRPIIYRNFIEGVSPRGIAVGYPEKVNLCWDADTMSLALLWQDRFIDASKHWNGRGQGNQVPLGGGTMKWESSSPFAVLESPRTPWPSETPKERGFRFKGYRLDSVGRPTFRFTSPLASVEDKPIPKPGDPVASLDRQIKYVPTGTKVEGRVYFRAAIGKSITRSDDGAFALGDGTVMRVSGEPILRNVDGTMEVIVPIDGATTIAQSIVW